jgi:hypothetical protein
MKIISYLASPYGHDDVKVRNSRFKKACLATVALMEAGHTVFCPIAHSHPIATLQTVDSGWDYWMEFDLAILGICKVLFVLAIDGWKESKGVAAEIEYAKRLGIPIYLLDMLWNITNYKEKDHGNLQRNPTVS